MSVRVEYPAFAVGLICVFGGVLGYVRTRSLPSIVAGLSVGTLYLWSANSIRSGNTPTGIKGALAASALLFLSSLPRVTKGPVPQVLAVSSAAAGVYYGRLYQ